MAFAASPGPGPATHGTLSKLFATKSECVFRLPAHVGLDEAVLIEPLAVAVRSARMGGVDSELGFGAGAGAGAGKEGARRIGEEEGKAGWRTGKKVVVFGAGTVGLLTAAVSRVFGAKEVVVVDINAERLAFAKAYAATGVYNPSSTTTTTTAPSTSATPENARTDGHQEAAVSSPAEHHAQELKRQFAMQHGADVAIDCSGAEPSVQTAFHVLAPGGILVQTGMGKPMIEVPWTVLGIKEIVVRGVFRYGPGDFDMAVRLVAEGKVKVKELISRVVGFEDATEAWEIAGRGEGIKTLIKGLSD